MIQTHPKRLDDFGFQNYKDSERLPRDQAHLWHINLLRHRKLIAPA